jgi:hypothetical protein
MKLSGAHLLEELPTCHEPGLEAVGHRAVAQLAYGGGGTWLRSATTTRGYVMRETPGSSGDEIALRSL